MKSFKRLQILSRNPDKIVQVSLLPALLKTTGFHPLQSQGELATIPEILCRHPQWTNLLWTVLDVQTKTLLVISSRILESCSGQQSQYILGRQDQGIRYGQNMINYLIQLHSTHVFQHESSTTFHLT